MNELLLTPKEASKAIRCSEGSLRASRVTGRIFGKATPPYIKRGRQIMYKRSTLMKWLDDFQEHPASTKGF